MANPNTLRVMLDQFQKVGLRGLFSNLLREGKMMTGTIVGQDKFGNKYYEDNEQMFGSNRRVDYAKADYDPSQVPAEWHRWLHYMTDDLPDPAEPRKKWQMDHSENKTGTTDAYVTYSTVGSKVQGWKP